MAKIAEQAEENTNYIAPKIFHKTNTFKLYNQIVINKEYTKNFFSYSLCEIVVCTRTGGTAKTISRFRPFIDVIGMTTDESAYRKLALSWGVIPIMSEVVYRVCHVGYFCTCRAGLLYHRFKHFCCRNTAFSADAAYKRYKKPTLYAKQ